MGNHRKTFPGIVSDSCEDMGKVTSPYFLAHLWILSPRYVKLFEYSRFIPMVLDVLGVSERFQDRFLK